MSLRGATHWVTISERTTAWDEVASEVEARIWPLGPVEAQALSEFYADSVTHGLLAETESGVVAGTKVTITHALTADGAMDEVEGGAECIVVEARTARSARAAHHVSAKLHLLERNEAGGL